MHTLKTAHVCYRAMFLTFCYVDIDVICTFICLLLNHSFLECFIVYKMITVIALQMAVVPYSF